jgi:hypothetical protein
MLTPHCVQRKTARIFLLLFTTLALPSLTYAAFTAVNPVGYNNGSERCLVGPSCSGGTYNNAISIIRAIEMDLGLSAGTITRVDDDFDRIWEATSLSGGQVLARARYAGDTNYLGYDTGSGYNYLINSGPNNKVLVDNTVLFTGSVHASDFVDYGAPSWVNIPTALGQDFAFILNDSTIGKKWTSNNSGSGAGASGYDNSGGLDQMVTFKIADNHYLIAWEDRPYNSSDTDFNDFVAEVKFVQAVPVPAALWLFGSAIGMLRLWRRRH